MVWHRSVCYSLCWTRNVNNQGVSPCILTFPERYIHSCMRQERLKDVKIVNSSTITSIIFLYWLHEKEQHRPVSYFTEVELHSNVQSIKRKQHWKTIEEKKSAITFSQKKKNKPTTLDCLGKCFLPAVFTWGSWDGAKDSGDITLRPGQHPLLPGSIQPSPSTGAVAAKQL